MREHVDGDRLELVAQALTVASHQRRGAGDAEEDAEDQQQDTQHGHGSRPFS
ncbi:MAG: hypothetical protein H0X28_16080 [Solirubrobacterales bacterium]|nr:hypothetical protein [Solirubrobacterales bacterium]